MRETPAYPVRVDASLDVPLSRWLWLVKWLLLIPHFVVLAVLWIAFLVLSVIAFFAILFTESYPSSIFEFNVGVLRWTWRVQYYGIGAFGTDRYPPFTLADDPTYPAHLEVEYPRRLSRGLVLVKWWLLAIPQYIVVAVFGGGGVWWGEWQASGNGSWDWPGLIAILAVFAMVAVLFTGRYPGHLFDFTVGMDRWAFRVAAYVGLLTDVYPPFRLDMGGTDPAGMTIVPPPPQPPPGPPPEQPPQPPAEPRPEPEPEQPPQPPPAPPPQPPERPPQPPDGGWTAGRVVAVVAGSVFTLISVGLFVAGGSAVWADTVDRQGGYVDLGSHTYFASGYAITSDNVTLDQGRGWASAGSLFGTVRIHATSANGKPAFAGIAPSPAASQYLAGVARAIVRGRPGTAGWHTEQTGTAPAVPPVAASFWDARVAGFGTQTLTWPVRDGDWTVIVMNADGSAPVSMRVGVAATIPALPWIAGILLAGGFVALAAGVVFLAIPIRQASRRPAAPRP